MHLAEGKVGQQAVISMTCIAMATAGLFSFYSGELYPNGNSTYVSFPVGVLIAGLVFMLAAAAMKACNANCFIEMLEFSVGKFFARIICAVFIVYCIVAAILPLNRFLNIMFNSFFINSNYFTISVFIYPVLVVFSLLGLEPICRTARALVWFFLLAHMLMLGSEAGGLEITEMAPIMGDGIKNTAIISLKSSAIFLPALLFILMITRSVHGIKFAKRAASFAVPITTVFCGITYLALAMMFNYVDLTNIYTPLYRYSMAVASESLILRLDKNMSFIWIMAILLSGSYYVYASSNIYAKIFSQNDMRPAAMGVALMLLSIAVGSHLTFPAIKDVFDFLRNYGFFIFVVPVILVSGIAIVRASILNNRRKYEVGTN